MFTCFGIKHLSLSVLYNEEKYTIITLVNILGKTLALALLISITYLDNIRLMHLLLVTLLSEIIAIATILLNISKNSFRPRVSFNAELFKKQRDIVGYKSAQDLINKLGGQLPIIFARNFVDTATAGNYFIALKMVQSPLSIISKSIRDVVFVEYGKLKSSVGNTFTRNFIMIHLLVFVAIYSVLWIFSDLLANILSNEWLLSAKLLFYIIPILLSNSLASVFRDNLLILKRGRFVLKIGYSLWCISCNDICYLLEI